MAERRRLSSFDRRPRSWSSISVTSEELEVQDLYPLYPKGLDVPFYLCERVMNELGKAVVTSIQLDAETVSNLVALRIINDGQQLRNASGSCKSESERVLDYLCPAVKRGGNRALERLYQVLMYTRVGRMGHEELAKNIKRKANKYINEFHMRRQSSKHPLVDTHFKGLHMYRQHLFENLNFSLFGQAAEQSGFLDETECKRLLKLWQEDKDKAVSTLVEATEAKGPAGFGMFLSTLQGTLYVEGIDTTTREQHRVLLHELSRVEPCEPTEMGSSPSFYTAYNGISADNADKYARVPHSYDRVVLQDILHRLEMLERAKSDRDSTAATPMEVRPGIDGGCSEKESSIRSAQCCDVQELDKVTKEMTKGRDSLLKEDETLIRSLQEQVRTLTLEVEELRTLQKRRKDVDHAMKPEIADLEEKLNDSEMAHCLWTESEQKLAKTKEESMLYRAALNACRKRIKSLEGTSGGLPEEEPPSVECLVATAKQLCASLKVAHISEDVSQQKQKMVYFSLKDFLCQAQATIEQKLRDI